MQGTTFRGYGDGQTKHGLEIEMGKPSCQRLVMRE